MSDWFTKAFGHAVTDVRQKLVEEAWFGRAVTPRRLAELGNDRDTAPMAERLGWDRPAADQRQPSTRESDGIGTIDRQRFARVSGLAAAEAKRVELDAASPPWFGDGEKPPAERADPGHSHLDRGIDR